MFQFHKEWKRILLPVASQKFLRENAMEWTQLVEMRIKPKHIYFSCDWQSYIIHIYLFTGCGHEALIKACWGFDIVVGAGGISIDELSCLPTYNDSVHESFAYLYQAAKRYEFGRPGPLIEALMMMHQLSPPLAALAAQDVASKIIKEKLSGQFPEKKEG